MTTDETAQLQLLRQEVQQDIKLAIANFKIWLLLTVLSNVVLIGVPALYVFFNTTNTAQAALSLSSDNRHKLEAMDRRLTAVEQYEIAHGTFRPVTPVD